MAKTIRKPLTQLTVRGNSTAASDIETAIAAVAAASHNNIDASDNASDNANDGAITAVKNGGAGGGNTLDLYDVFLTPTLVEEVIELIRLHSEWESIIVWNCAGDPGLCADLFLACTTHQNIKSFALKPTPGNTSMPTPAATMDALAYGIKYNSRLTKLEMRGLRLNVAVADLISRALLRNTTLRELGMDETHFLLEPDTGDNVQKNSAVQILSFGLRFNKSIECLSFDYCVNLEDEDVAMLINAVNSYDTILRRLSLQYSPCMSEGMGAIADLLRGNVIEDLDLSYLVRRRKRPKKETEKKEDETKTQEDDDKEAAQEETQESEEESDGGESTTDAEPKSEPETEKTDDVDRAEQQKVGKAESDKEDDPHKLRNTSLKRLAMVGNGLNDDYLVGLLDIFTPKRKKGNPGELEYSNLEELNLFGNRFSNYGIKELLKSLPRFPFMQRLYLGFQQAPAVSPLLARLASGTDRTEPFTPGSLEKEFVRAVADVPENFRLAEVHIMAKTKEDKAVNRILRYYTRLNSAGRRILAAPPGGSSGGSGNPCPVPTKNVPLGLWPLVLERANKLHPLPSSSSPGSAVQAKEPSDDPENALHAGDVAFCLLHGPMLFENPYLVGNDGQ